MTLLLFLAVFLWDFPGLWQVWTTDPRLSHAPLVVLLAASLLWNKRGSWHFGTTGGSGALALIACCALLHVGAVWADIACLKPLALIGIAGGVIALHGGWPRLAQASGVLGWLLFLIPWPTTLTASLQFWMQIVSSRWATLFCGMGGIPIRCQGVELFVQPEGALAPTVRVLVAQPCSGLTSTLALLAVAYFLALLTPARLWARSLLALSAIPCALILNALRITLIVSASASHRPGLADWLHTHEEPVLVLLCSLTLLGLRAALLACFASPPLRAYPNRPGTGNVPVSEGFAQASSRTQMQMPIGISSKPEPDTSALNRTYKISGWRGLGPTVLWTRIVPCCSDFSLKPTFKPTSSEKQAFAGREMPHRFLAALNLVLLLTLAGSILGARLESAAVVVPDFLPGLALPYPGWRQTTVPLAAKDLAALDPDSLLMRRWTNAQGNWTELTVIAGHRKRVLHAPAYCLRGGGWEPLAENDITLRLPSRSVSAASLTMTQGDQRILVTYFFSDGSVCSPALTRFQAAQIWRRLQPGSHGPSIAALIRIVTPLRGENLHSAQAQTQAFARATLPAVLDCLHAINF